MAGEVYRKHPNHLTEEEETGLLSFIALRILELEEEKAAMDAARAKK